MANYFKASRRGGKIYYSARVWGACQHATLCRQVGFDQIYRGRGRVRGEAAGLRFPIPADLRRFTLRRLYREREALVSGAVADAAEGTVRAVFESWLEYKAATGRQTRGKARGERQPAKVAREFCKHAGPDRASGDTRWRWAMRM